MIRAVIIEDEPLAARFLQELLHKTGKVEVVALAHDCETGLLRCADHIPDAVFLDIRMPGPDGLELAAHLAVLPNPPLVVFTTGHANRAHEAFRLEAVDYLLKPLDPAQVWEAVRRLEAHLADGHVVGPEQTPEIAESPLGLQDDRLPVKIGRDDIVKLLPLREIVAALRHHRRTWIHTRLEEYPTYHSLADLMEWMHDPPFFRVSREAIINLQGVDEVIHYGDRLYQVRLRDRRNTCVAASRSGAQRLAGLLRPPN